MKLKMMYRFNTSITKFEKIYKRTSEPSGMDEIHSIVFRYSRFFYICTSLLIHYTTYETKQKLHPLLKEKTTYVSLIQNLHQIILVVIKISKTFESLWTLSLTWNLYFKSLTSQIRTNIAKKTNYPCYLIHNPFIRTSCRIMIHFRAELVLSVFT